MLKYQNKSFYPEKLHPNSIDRMSTDLVPASSKVLEIGCATGFMGHYLQKKKKCKVVGVEINSEEASHARKNLYKVIHGNIEDPQILKKIKNEGKFDVILASALIEHLKDPWTDLKNWKSLLKRNGQIIITTSNIAHFSARIKLFRGEFPYSEYGLFDNTHLRFFTTNSFPKLITDSGYKIIEFKKDMVGGGYPKISQILGLFFPNLFTYQMVIKAKK